MFTYIFVIYLIIINLIAYIFTSYDKMASKTRKRRISENTLLFIGLLGGSAAMYITMKLIHHKTRHFIFMVGLPFIFIVEMILFIFVAKSLHLFG